jgi:hypothetical protein
MPTHKIMVWLLGLTVVCTLSGCATLQFPWDQKVPEASAKNPVVQITCLWEPSEGRDQDGHPSRGFAGQILFLANKGGTPVKVNGEVSVYVFDDQGTLEEQARPLHHFKFDSLAWSQHLRVGTLGPTYHVFIPYTRKGTFEANCTVRVKLSPADGQPVFSDSCNIPLRGKKRNLVPAAEVISRPGESADYETFPPRSSRTTTIPFDGRDSAAPAMSPELNDRAQYLLQQFLKEQAAEDLKRAQQTSDVTRGYTSERIRINGQRVEVVSPGPQKSLAHLLPEQSETDAAPRRNPLSSHPLAEQGEPRPLKRSVVSQAHWLETDPVGGDSGIVPAGYTESP